MKKYELEIFLRLLVENKDSNKLQKISGAGYLESIHLINKFRDKLNKQVKISV